MFIRQQCPVDKNEEQGNRICRSDLKLRAGKTDPKERCPGSQVLSAQQRPYGSDCSTNRSTHRRTDCRTYSGTYGRTYGRTDSGTNRRTDS